jgi:hypothetical protein
LFSLRRSLPLIETGSRLSILHFGLVFQLDPLSGSKDGSYLSLITPTSCSIITPLRRCIEYINDLLLWRRFDITL